jgi:23S rRNA pseudouridine1911/1915/1917 synthase
MNYLEDIQSRVLFEDNHLLIVNKRAGEIVQGDKTGDITLIDKVKNYLKIKYQKPFNVFCGLVHRIDRPVSGVVVFAKTSKALSRMNQLVKERKFKKLYWAIVELPPEIKEQTLSSYIVKNEKLNKSFISFVEKPGYQKCELSYKTVGSTERYTLLEVILQTGRHHQIRAQLAANKTIIKGDLKYGAHRSNEDGSICLHARKVEFEHPITHQLISVEAEPSTIIFRKIWGI